MHGFFILFVFMSSGLVISCSSTKSDNQETDVDSAVPTDEEVMSGDEDTITQDENETDDEIIISDSDTMSDSDTIPDTDDFILDDDISESDTDSAIADADVDDPPGLNSHAFQFQGIIRDLDPVDGGVLAYGGYPNTLYRCIVSDLKNVQCLKIADIPTTGFAVTYHSGPFGGIATTEVESTGIEIFKVDEESVTPAAAVIGSITVSTLTIISGGGDMLFDLYHPGGIAAYVAPDAPEERFFVGIAEAVNEGVSTGMILSYANQDGNWASPKMPGLVHGLRTAGLGTTTLDLGSGEKKTYLVALNSGEINISDSFESGIAIFDMDGSSVLRVKYISLGEIELAPLPEISLDTSGKSIFVPVVSPVPEIREIDIETGSETSSISLSDILAGNLNDMVVSEGRIYIADSDGAILFFDISSSSFLGSLSVPEPPTALAVSGNYLYAVVGDMLYVMEKNMVNTQTDSKTEVKQR